MQRAYRWALLSIFACALLFVASNSLRVRADENNESEESKIQKGFLIAPVPLNLNGKNRELVGLGSYIVNAQADCNGCHSAGPPTEFVSNPYFGKPEVINQATYLGGSRDFGTLTPNPGSAHIVSRNLTPDHTGLPEGGHTFEEFRQIIRTGVDMDHLHPTCPIGTVSGNCVPFPFDGDLLQIMPWPIYKNMSDHDLRAIYEYLSAVPCIAGPPAPDPRHNDC